MSANLSSVFQRRRPALTSEQAGYMASHYRYFRVRRRMSAKAALEAAKELPAAYVKGRGYYGPSGVAGAPFKDGADILRHVDDTEALNLRFVGYADELSSLRHTGWFTEDDGDNGETLRGGVWQLTGRKGRARLLYGYREMEGRGEMNPGSAVLCVSHIVDGEKDDGIAPPGEAVAEAARFADGLAESVAEEQRDYNRSYREGRQAAEADAEALEARAELLPLLEELRRERKRLGAPSGMAARPAICAALRARVDSLLETIREKRAERDKAWRDCPGYAEEAWRAGFMDEAANGFVRAVRLGYAKASDWRGAPESNPCNAA